MADFCTALYRTLQHEGFYANIKGDRGGETYRGISRKANPYWKGWKYVDHEKHLMGGALPRNYRIKDQPELDQHIETLYHQQYWTPLKLDEICLQALADLMFDSFVHSYSKGVNCIQLAANRLGYYPPLKVDGAYGPVTHRAVLTTDQVRLYHELREERRKYLISFATRKHQGKFLKGFMARIDSFKNIA